MLKKLGTVLVASVMLVGCSGNKTNEEETNTNKNFKVGMVTNLNGIDDQSFNQATWEGLVKFGKDHKLKEEKGYRYLQAQSEADFIPNLNQFAEGNYNLTIGVGFPLETAVKDVATQHTDKQFAIIDAVVDEPNVTSILFKEEEGSYLAGIAAGLTTKTNTVGFIGGVDSDLIKKFEAGFAAGVKEVNPKAKVIVQYAGSFGDAGKGSSIASSVYSQGADVIYHAAGGTGNGVFTEAKNRAKKGEKVWVIGVDSDQHEQGMPENVTLTSMVKNVSQAVYNLSKEAYDGTLKGGKTIVYGVKEDGINLITEHGNLSDKVLSTMEEYKVKIKNGEIEIPTKP